MKNQTSLLSLSILFIGLFLFTGCSQQGFSAGGTQAASQGSGEDQPEQEGSGGGGSGSNGDNSSAQLDALDLKGEVDSSSSLFGSALTFDFDKTRGEFILMLPMPSGIMVLPSGSFSKYPDITFSQILDSTGRLKMGVRIPAKYILKGVQNVPTASLPNGDALPAMPQGYGELPSLALSFPQHNNMQMYLYLGVSAVGLYVTLPSSASIPFSFTVPIRNKSKTTTYGYLTYVPPKGTYSSGLFISSILPPSVARVLEDYLKL